MKENLLYQKYYQKIREQVCPRCIDFGADGHCTLKSELDCQIMRHLPETILVIESVDSPKLEDYILKLSKKVCAYCSNQKDGQCAMRDMAECALDSYFELVVEAIEEEKIKKG